jgi:hypothetical protein
MMAGAVYIVGTLMALCCAILLLRGYARGRQRSLLWGGLCFFGLAISNALVFVDLIVRPTQTDLYLPRLVTAALAMLLCCTGLYGRASDYTRSIPARRHRNVIGDRRYLLF